MINLSVSEAGTRPIIILIIEKIIYNFSNLLQPLTTTDVYHKVKYTVNIYRGGDFIRNGNYAVQISFAANVVLMHSLLILKISLTFPFQIF